MGRVGLVQTPDQPRELSRALDLPEFTPDAMSFALPEAFRRLQEYLSTHSLAVGGMPAIALAIGGKLIRAAVTASIATTPNADTQIRHDLGRIPESIAWYRVIVPASGTPPVITAQLIGHPQGGWGAQGGNHQAWTTSIAYVRSSVDAEFEFVLV